MQLEHIRGQYGEEYSEYFLPLSISLPISYTDTLIHWRRLSVFVSPHGPSLFPLGNEAPLHPGTPTRRTTKGRGASTLSMQRWTVACPDLRPTTGGTRAAPRGAPGCTTAPGATVTAAAAGTPRYARASTLPVGLVTSPRLT